MVVYESERCLEAEVEFAIRFISLPNEAAFGGTRMRSGVLGVRQNCPSFSTLQVPAMGNRSTRIIT